MNMTEALDGDGRDVTWSEADVVFLPGTIVDGSSWYHWAPPGQTEDEWVTTTLQIPLASAA